MTETATLSSDHVTAESAESAADDHVTSESRDYAESRDTPSSLVEFTIDHMEIKTRSKPGEKEVHYKIPPRTIRGHVHSKFIHLVIENPLSHDRDAKPLPKAPMKQTKLDKTGQKMVQGRWGGKFRNLWVDAGVFDTYDAEIDGSEGENREIKKRRVGES